MRVAEAGGLGLGVVSKDAPAEVAEAVAVPEPPLPVSGGAPDHAGNVLVEAALPAMTEMPPDLAGATSPSVEAATAEGAASAEPEVSEEPEACPLEERIEAAEHFQEYRNGLWQAEAEGPVGGTIVQGDARDEAEPQTDGGAAGASFGHALADGLQSELATAGSAEGPPHVAADPIVAAPDGPEAAPAEDMDQAGPSIAPAAAAVPVPAAQPRLEVEQAVEREVLRSTASVRQEAAESDTVGVPVHPRGGAQPDGAWEPPDAAGRAPDLSRGADLEVAAAPVPAAREVHPGEPRDGRVSAAIATAVPAISQPAVSGRTLPPAEQGSAPVGPRAPWRAAAGGAVERLPGRLRLAGVTNAAEGVARSETASDAVRRALPLVRRALWGAGAVAAGLVVAVLVLAVAYRWVNPPVSTLMLGQRLAGTPIERRWVPIERISPNLIRAVVLSEDAGFCRHGGVDWAAIEEAMEGDRGGSTITMQVVKNLFLWPSRSYVRKAIEIGLAYIVESLWPKQRIMEIYLNIAEWGDGVFGAEAAARAHFDKRAARLTVEEAALLAVSLPNPIERTPAAPSLATGRLASRLMQRMTASRVDLSCLPVPRALPRKLPVKGPLVQGP
jgi:monofunctional biosynthetic peptidoglycan transglycosylase